MHTDAPRHRSPVSFVSLTFALSVPFWILGAVAKTPEDTPVALPLSALQVIAPLAAASILVYRGEGGRSLRRFLRRLIDAGRAASWTKYSLIVIVMPAIYGLGYLAMRATGRHLAGPAVAAGSILVLFAVFLVTAVFEEGGWTAYALDPLQDRWGMARAALALGLVWAAFHFVADVQGGHDLGWILLHRTSATALRVLIVCAYNVTGKGVLAAVLLHAMDNISWQLLPGTGSYDPAYVMPLTVGVAILVYVWTVRVVSRRPAVDAVPLMPGSQRR